MELIDSDSSELLRATCLVDVAGVDPEVTEAVPACGFARASRSDFVRYLLGQESGSQIECGKA